MLILLTIDEILGSVDSFGIEKLNSSVSVRDRRILKNLVKLIKTPGFITEGQGKLLVKILQENL